MRVLALHSNAQNRNYGSPGAREERCIVENRNKRRRECGRQVSNVENRNSAAPERERNAVMSKIEIRRGVNADSRLSNVENRNSSNSGTREELSNVENRNKRRRECGSSSLQCRKSKLQMEITSVPVQGSKEFGKRNVIEVEAL